VTGRCAADLALIADQVEAEAYADLYAAAPPELQAMLGLEVRRLDGMTLLLAPRIPTPIFNRAIGLGSEQLARAETVEGARDLFRRAGVGNWWLHWNPFARPADFPDTLRTLGFIEPARRAWAKVLRGPEPPPHIATDLDIASAQAEEVGAVMGVVAQAFGMPSVMATWLSSLHRRPRWRIYAVRDHGRAVGGACLFVDGDRAWLGVAAVAESHRRRGAQGAVMALRISDAIAAGCRYLVTETGEPVADEPNPSLSNMKRCGFRQVASRLNFEAPSR
jgi:hypothetical protein